MSQLIAHLPAEELQQLIADLPWYHSFAFPNGLKTQGVYDNAPTLPHYGLPASLAGKQVLDVGTADGFFAFELERRGAAHVLALDPNQFDGSLATDVSQAYREKYNTAYQDLYANQYAKARELLAMKGMNQFLIAKDLLDSEVEYRNLTIYELDQLGQKFDLVLCGDLIEHLKSPLIGLENLVNVTGDLCIIALSGAIKTTQDPQRFRDRLIKSLARRLGVPWPTIDYTKAVEYMGNVSGRSFFRFHPLAFREALLASGFRQVEIQAEFDLLNNKWGNYSPHVIFHCRV